MLTVCLMSTGCLRIMMDTMGRSLSKGSYTSHAGDYYFYGLKLVGDSMSGPFAPVGIVDCTFELAIDLMVLPFKCLDAKGMRQRRQERIEKMEPIYLAQEGLIDEFKIRLASMSAIERCALVDWLVYGEGGKDGHTRRMLKCIYIMCEYDTACFEYLLNSYRSLSDWNLDVYQYLFSRGLSARNITYEYAVFYALVANWGHPRERQLNLLKLLIENGCNPNTTPPHWSAEEHINDKMTQTEKFLSLSPKTPMDLSLQKFWSDEHEKYKDKMPLDLALSQLEYRRKVLEQHPMSESAQYEMRYAEEVVKFLREHGAKTSEEMKEK